MATAAAQPQLAFTVAEAAALIGISRWTYYERVKAGELPGRRSGNRIIVPRVQLERWLETGDWRQA